MSKISKSQKELFNNSKSGVLNYKKLKHKNGDEFTDLDYFELIGRKAIEMDEQNPNPRIPTNYGELDRNVVEVAKQVVKALDDGMNKNDVAQFISNCIDEKN